MAADLDAIAAHVHEHPALDLSPRGLRPRPDPDLDALLGRLDGTEVPELRDRLSGERDPILALTWLRALLSIDNTEALEVIAGYADRLEREDPWPGVYPGRRELLLFLGRDQPVESS